MAQILLVDDEDDMRQTLSVILAQKGHTIGEAGSALAAYEKLNTTKYDLILLDIRMPDIDGLEALAEIRHLSDHRLLVQGEEPKAVNHVLVRACDEGFLRSNVVVQHAELPTRRDGQDAAQQAWVRCLGDGVTAIEHVDHRPTPNVSHSGNRLGILAVNHHVCRRLGDLR